MNYHFTKVLFLDIETAAIQPNFDDVNPVLQQCFEKKFAKELHLFSNDAQIALPLFFLIKTEPTQ